MANIKGTINRDTRKYLRVNGTEEWRQQCLRKSNYKCEITGKQGTPKYPLDVHHKNITFDYIMTEAHKKLGIEHHKSITEYKSEDLAALVEEIKIMHKEVEGVVMRHSIHMEFHSYYGKKATADDYKAFKKYKKTRLYKSKNGSYKKTA